MERSSWLHSLLSIYSHAVIIFGICMAFQSRQDINLYYTKEAGKKTY